MSGSILNWVAHSWNRLFTSKELRPYERLVLDAWRVTLNSRAQHVLDVQLQATELVQRQAGDAKVCFYYRANAETPLFKIDQPDVHAASVVLRTERDKTLRAKIFLHRGRFFSIEFPKRPNRYLHQHHMHEQVLQVASVECHVAVD